MPGNAPYCAAKGGVRMLTRTAGVELAPHGITVVGVAPGAVHTPIDEVTLADPVARAKLEGAIPLGRVAEPDGDREPRGVPGVGRGVLRHGDDLRRRRRDDAGERRPLGDARAGHAPRCRPSSSPPTVAPARRARAPDRRDGHARRRRTSPCTPKRATAIELLLFDRVDDDVPARVIDLDPRSAIGPVPTGTRSCRASGAGQVYGYRAHGPWAPESGLRFDGDRILLDPYGRGVAVPDGYRRTAAARASRPTGRRPAVDEERRRGPRGVRLGGRPAAGPAVRATPSSTRPTSAGFTANPNSGVDPALRGTYAGFIEKIPYLVDLGVTAVELLPVYQFDAQEAPGGHPNYWGYQPVSFFAPHGAYASRPGAQAAVDEFRDLVKALHRAGLEVILDVVYNHTAESGDDGPTFGYRGLANDDYYILDPSDRARYADYSGCGNTLNANEPVVRRLILDSLRVLGRRHARRRLPVRPRGRAVAGRGRGARSPAADHLGHRDGPGPGRHEAHRRGVGRRRPVPGRLVRRRPLDRVERALPGRRPVVRQERPGQGVGGRPAPARPARHLRTPRARAPEDDQLRDLPRRVHAQRRRLVRPQAQRGERRGQPRRQRRQRVAGTAASKGRPTTRRSRRSARARCGTCWRSSCWRWASRC